MGNKIRPKNEKELKENLPEKDFEIFQEVTQKELGNITVLKEDFEIDDFERFMEEPRDLDWYFEKDGFATYRFEKDGQEYNVYLFEKGKGIVSYSTVEGDDEDDFDFDTFQKFYVGACKRGDKDFIAFSEPIKEERDDKRAFIKAKALAIELLKDK